MSDVLRTNSKARPMHAPADSCTKCAARTVQRASHAEKQGNASPPMPHVAILGLPGSRFHQLTKTPESTSGAACPVRGGGRGRGGSAGGWVGW